MNTDEQFIKAYGCNVAMVDEEELREFIKCYNNNYCMWETAIKIGENK